MSIRTPLLALSLALLLSPPAGGQGLGLDRTHFTLGEHVLVTLPGRVEAIGGYADGLAVDQVDPLASDTIPRDMSLATRLRLAPSLIFVGERWPVFTAYQLVTDFDVRHEYGDAALDELLAFDPVQSGRNKAPIPRLLEARAAAIGEYMAVSIGLTRSYWGLGMLANDGRAQPISRGASPFGYARTTDRVMRVQVAAYPLGRAPEGEASDGSNEPPLTVGAAADAVVEDDTANWVHGDRTWHAVGALRGAVAGFLGGLYAVHRRQTHAEGGQTNVTVLDMYLRQELKAPEVRIWAELEGAVTFGDTTYAQNPLQPGPQDVLSGGALLRIGAMGSGFGLVLEGGFASGDDNPFDREQHSFTFDREHRVGLLMFREALRKSTAVSAANIADPDYRAEPPRGFDQTATGGAVRGAFYINPRVTFELVEGLTFMAGYLHASSDGFYTDPFQSGLLGGASAGLRGALMSRNFGDEIDIGVDYVLDLDAVRLRFRGEFAWFAPGDIFAGPTGTDKPAEQMGGWLHSEVSW